MYKKLPFSNSIVRDWGAVLILTFLFNLTLSYGQCPPGGSITITTQAQINSFATDYPGCTMLPGGLIIQESTPGSITNLNGLSQLTSIGGNLLIALNESLTNLNGLDNIATVGGILQVIANDALISLSGLGMVTAIGGDLRIEVNGALPNLSGLDMVTTVGGELKIEGNEALISLSGLDNLTSIAGNLIIIANDALVNLSGLGKLKSIGGGLGIAINQALTSLSGLDMLTTIGGYIHILANDVLTSLSGLNLITAIGGYLKIEFNNALPNLNGLDMLTTVGGELKIEGNEALINLSGLGNLTTIVGDLLILFNNALTSLSGLDNVTTVEGTVGVVSNDALPNLSGLGKLTTIGKDLVIWLNGALTSLSGLDMVTTIGRDLKIEDNISLKSISALDGVTAIGGELRIEGNGALNTLFGLENINHTTITDLTIQNNAILCTCDVLSICNYLDIPSNTASISGNVVGTCNTRLEVETACITAPIVIACPSDVIISCDESNDPAIVGSPIVTDNCDPAPVITFVDAIVPGQCANTFVIIRNWTATDEFGFVDNCVQTIDVEDITPPSLVCPATANVSCTGSIDPTYTGMPTAIDDCSGMITPTFTDISNQSTEDCGQFTYTIERTWTAVDECGNASTCLQLIEVVDNDLPIEACPLDITLACNESLPAPVTNLTDFVALGGVVYDNCTTSLSDYSISSFTISSGGMDCSLDPPIFIRTYTIQDACGNTTTCNQVFTFLENTQGPVITSVAPTCYKYCSSLLNPKEADINYMTDCPFGATVSISGPQIIGPPNCTGTIYRFTYTVTDNCGGLPAQSTRDFIIGNQGPTINCAPFNLILECGDPNNQDYIDTHLGLVTANSSCQMEVDITHFPTNFNLNTCGTATVVTFIATDACDRTATCTTTIAILDNTAPEFTTIPPNICDVINCSADVNYWYNHWINYMLDGLTAEDDCDANVSITPSNFPLNTNCENGSAVTVVTFSATDNCNNTSTVTGTFTIENNPPITICPPDITIEWGEPEDPSATGTATATDDCDPNPAITYTDNVILTGVCPVVRIIERMWTANDLCGGSSSCIQVISVTDLSPPNFVVPDTVTIDWLSNFNGPSTSPAENVPLDPRLDPSCFNANEQFGPTTEKWYLNLPGGTDMVQSHATVGIVIGNPTGCDPNDPSKVQIDLDGPTIIERAAADDIEITDSPCGDYSENGANDVIETEIEQMRLEGFGGFKLRVGAGNGVGPGAPLQPSKGTIVPLPGDTLACSFFEVWFEIEIPFPPFFLYNQVPMLIRDTIDRVPPLAIYVHLFEPPGCIGLFDANGNFIATLVEAVHKTVPIEVTDNCDPAPIMCFRDTLHGPFYNYCEIGLFVIERTWIAKDNCGNVSAPQVQRINLIDTIPPVISGIPADITIACTDPIPEVPTVTATDNCDPNPMVAMDETSDPGDCPVEGDITRVWTASDACGNTSTGFATITFTTPPGVSMTGVIATAESETVEKVAVTLEGNSSVMDWFETGTDGIYGFNNLDEGQNYSVTPYLNEDLLNGVSSFDLVLMVKHILQMQALDSPYKIIAADINNSGSITTMDILELRKVILHINDMFPNNTSWRFIESTFVFPEPTNPFVTLFPEEVNINGLTSDEQHDFVGVKVGDVNGSAVPNALARADDRTFVGDLIFDIADQRLKAGERIEVTFHANNFYAIHGYQFSLNFDQMSLDFTSISTGELSNLNESNFGLSLLEEGVITTSWTNQKGHSLIAGTPLFHVSFTAKENILLSEVINVSSRYTKAEAYNGNLGLLNVQLRFESEEVVRKGFLLYQNMPNPFKQETLIGFELPKASKATLNVYDVSGTLLEKIAGDFTEGYNSISLSAKGLSGGLLYYKLVTPTHTATKKMVRMH